MKGSISQRSPSTWMLRFDLGIGPDGKRKQKVVTVRGTKKDAERELRRLIHELETGAFVDPGRVSLGDYLRRWLAEYAKPNVSPKTYERYEEIVTKHLIPALGGTSLGKLQPLTIQSYYNHAMVCGRRDGRGALSKQTVLHHHRILHKALQQAVVWGLLAHNPADRVEAPRPEVQERPVLDLDATVALLEAASGDRLYMPVLLAVTTGLRLGEVLGLRWQDVDLKNGMLWVRQALEQTRAGLRFKAPKTHKSKRPNALLPLVVDELVEHRRGQVRLRSLLGAAWKEHGLVCVQDNGEPWPPKIISKAFEHLAAQAGRPEIRFHDLRHSHASQLLANGETIGVVSERLGHARRSTTMDIYGHLLPGMQEQAALRADAVLRAALEGRNTRRRSAS